jgi:hypothetical protein
MGSGSLTLSIFDPIPSHECWRRRLNGNASFLDIVKASLVVVLEIMAVRVEMEKANEPGTQHHNTVNINIMKSANILLIL